MDDLPVSNTHNPLYAESIDPGVVPARLAEIAARHPDLHVAIASNPACYPALRQWMIDSGTPLGEAPASVARRHRRSRALIWGSLALAVLLLAGGGIWVYAAVSSKLDGSATPQAAVEKLLTGAAALDPLSVYGALSPAEVESLRAPVESLGAIKADEEAGIADYKDLSEKLTKNLEITVSNLGFEVEDIEEGITAVTVTKGSLLVDGDPEQLADIVLESTTPQTTRQLKDEGYSAAEIEDSLAATRRRATVVLNDSLPFTLNAAEVLRDGGPDLTMVTVQEGGSWYVSPLLTVSEHVFRTMKWSDSTVSRGTLVPAADVNRYADADAAAKGFAEEVAAYLSGGDYRNLAAALPLAERRVMSLYGTLIPRGEGGSDVVASRVQTSSTVSGDTARLEFVDSVFTGDGYNFWDSVVVDGVCLTFETYGSTESTCFDDEPVWAELGAADFRIVAVREGDGWLVSPLHTVADAGSIFVDNLARLSESDELADLLAQQEK